jgi:hypothetical protein
METASSVRSNRIAVRCTGPRIELYANDKLLVAAKKETFAGEGRLALVVTGVTQSLPTL